MARETETSTNNQADIPEPGDGQPLRRSRLENRAARQARREELRKQQRQANFRQKWLLWIIVVLVVVAAIAAWIMIEVVPKTAAVTGVQTFGNLSQDHVQGPVNYPQTPPVGGPHNAVWLNCGVYDTPQPKENAVHSMEHGAVWITYQQDLPDDQVQELRNLVRGKAYTLLSPWGGDPPLPSPIVASAWGVQMKVDNASDSRLSSFISRYANGTQTPEKGALCSGGMGTPIQ